MERNEQKRWRGERAILKRGAALGAMLGAAFGASLAWAGDGHELKAHNHADAVRSPEASATPSSVDILAAHAHRDGRLVTFHMTMRGDAGLAQPAPKGALAGAPVAAYVWPTTLDPSVVGFDQGAGLLALAATSHPDFDDTPLFDEDGDGDPGNDGLRWHSHWVVLAETPGCGAGALAVVDIPEGAAPSLPATWPGLPLLIDSPGYTPLFQGQEVVLTVPLPESATAEGVGYDGVTAALRVNANIHAPLLCVEKVLDVASGDLSLPGRLR